MQPSLFEYARKQPPEPSSNDYYVLPASEKQVHYARAIALRLKAELPAEIINDRSRLSAWIDKHKNAVPENKYARYPSSKQVAFAERIARLKRRPVPPECFRDRGMMSKWIDSNR